MKCTDSSINEVADNVISFWCSQNTIEGDFTKFFNQVKVELVRVLEGMLKSSSSSSSSDCTLKMYRCCALFKRVINKVKVEAGWDEDTDTDRFNYLLPTCYFYSYCRVKATKVHYEGEYCTKFEVFTCEYEDEYPELCTKFYSGYDKKEAV